MEPGPFPGQQLAIEGLLDEGVSEVNRVPAGVLRDEDLVVDGLSKGALQSSRPTAPGHRRQQHRRDSRFPRRSAAQELLSRLVEHRQAGQQDLAEGGRKVAPAPAASSSSA